MSGSGAWVEKRKPECPPFSTTLTIKGESYRLREKKKARLLGRRRAPPAAEVLVDGAAWPPGLDKFIGEKWTFQSVICGQSTSVLTGEAAAFRVSNDGMVTWAGHQWRSGLHASGT